MLLTLGTIIQIGIAGNLLPYLLLVFFATLLDYNLHRIIKLKLTTSDRNKYQWREENYSLLLAITLIAFLGLAVSMIIANRHVLWLLVPYAFMTMIYSFPFGKTGLKNWDIRKIPGIKNLLISITWTAVTCAIPIKLSGHEISGLQLILLITERFLFIFSITIPFDIRDTSVDRKAGLKTIPVVLGIRRSIRLTNILLLSFTTISVVQYTFYRNILMFAVMLISAIVTFTILNSRRLKKHPLYYPIFVDGSIIVHGLLLLSLML